MTAPTDWIAALPANPALRVAAWSALALGLTTLLVLLQVLAVSAWSVRERRLRLAFDRQWREELALAAIDPAYIPRRPRPRGRRRRWWLMQWNRMQRPLRGDATQRLNRALRLFGFEQEALRLLAARGVRKRLVALETLRHLADPRHWEGVAALVRVRNPFVALAAAQALVAMDPHRAMALLLPLAVDRVDWGVHRLQALCRQAGRDAVTAPLLRALDHGEPATLHRLVPLLASADAARAAPWARGCLAHDPDPRHRELALHTLADLGDPRDRVAVTAALADGDAGVRLAAIDALRRQARADDRARLLPLLADRSWWVRQRAADVLVALPGVDVAALEALAASLEDRYGREALARALATRRSGTPA